MRNNHLDNPVFLNAAQNEKAERLRDKLYSIKVNTLWFALSINKMETFRGEKKTA